METYVNLVRNDSLKILTDYEIFFLPDNYVAVAKVSSSGTLMWVTVNLGEECDDFKKRVGVLAEEAEVADKEYWRRSSNFDDLGALSWAMERDEKRQAVTALLEEYGFFEIQPVKC